MDPRLFPLLSLIFPLMEIERMVVCDNIDGYRGFKKKYFGKTVKYGIKNIVMATGCPTAVEIAC